MPSHCCWRNFKKNQVIVGQVSLLHGLKYSGTGVTAARLEIQRDRDGVLRAHGFVPPPNDGFLLFEITTK